MTEFPDGVITLLFTDIEGSTRLLERLRESYAEVLETHRTLLRDAFQLYGGQLVASQGDSSFIVFANAWQAVSAAAEAQRALHDYCWPPGCVVRVRMGLHTGQPVLVSNDYVGVDVHHVARLMAAASGGQVLLSQSLLNAVNYDWPADVKVLSLGRHQLKDLSQHEPIYQLIIEGLPEEFPPIRAVDLRPNNLPASMTPLVGRQTETAAALEVLRSPQARLLTLTATGGTGKTRLSLHVASSLMGYFEDGVFFVTLAVLRDATMVVPTIAQTLSITEAPGQTLFQSLEKYLKNRELLLVLDNFEQVVEAAPLIADLLAACPKLKVLATSRMALNLCGEHELPLPPLELPDIDNLPPVEKLSSVASVELFTQRACAVKPSFALDTNNATSIATICSRLEGLPLAIELAAPHLRMMEPEMILSRLEKRLIHLGGGARDLPERHQTLRECIAWSYNLLERNEQRLFTRLAVFQGGFTTSAVETIVESDNELTMLERMNLIKRVGDDDSPRFIMLERIREFAEEQLEASGDEKNFRHRHAIFFLHLTQEAAPRLLEKEQEVWLGKLDADQYNLRAALRWTMECEPQTALELVGSLWHYWEIRGRLNEGRKWLEGALEKTADAPATLRAKALSGAGKLAWHQGDYNAAEELFETALALHRSLDDKQNLATDISSLGLVAMHQGDMQRAKSLFEEGLKIHRELQDKVGILQLLVELQENALQCNINGLRALSEEGLELAREVGDKRAIAGSLMNIGFAAHYERNYEEAYTLFLESLKVSRELGEAWYATHALYALGKTLVAVGRWREAYGYTTESLELVYKHDFLWGIPYLIAVFGYIAFKREQWQYAVELYGVVQAMCDTAGTPLMPECGGEYQAYVALARQTFDETAFEIAWNKGYYMQSEDAIQYALRVADPLPEKIGS